MSRYLILLLNTMSDGAFRTSIAILFQTAGPLKRVVFPLFPVLRNSVRRLFFSLVSYYVCSCSVVVTAYYSESGRPGSNPEWGLIYYEASITAHGLPEPSSLWGSTLGTRAAEHKRL